MRALSFRSAIGLSALMIMLYPSLGCGNEIANGGTNATLSDCNSACTGDANEICGAGSEQDAFLPSRTSNFSSFVLKQTG